MGLGNPNKVLFDNGGGEGGGEEFDNPVDIEVTEQYNIKPMTTGANCPWRNGICEGTMQLLI